MAGGPLRHLRSEAMTPLPWAGAGTRPRPHPRSTSGARPRSRRLLLLGGTLAAGAAAGAAYKRLTRDGAAVTDTGSDDGRRARAWGDAIDRLEHRTVRTKDGAHLAVWDLDGDGPDAPVVVLPHCWGCSHEIWIPVARRLSKSGHRVVLYDQRGHGASTRGTAPLAIDTLAHDLEVVLEGTDVRDAVLAGHSMGGITIMSLAAERPQVLKERAKATVLVATAATASDGRNERGRPVTAGSAGGRRRDRVPARQPGAARSERTSVRARCLRRGSGAIAHGSDPGALRGLSRHGTW